MPRRTEDPTTLRALHVLASSDRRGAEVFAADLAEALVAHGWRSSLVALRRSTAPATVDADVLDGGRPSQLRSLRRLAAQHDVVIAHGSTSLPACALACPSAAPFVYRSIGDPSFWSSGGLRRLRTDLLLSRAHTVVALFDRARDVLAARGISAGLDVIPNAVRSGDFPLVTEEDRRSARAELGLEPSGPLVLFLGALSAEKRSDRAVELARSLPAATVLVVGSGPLEADLSARARSLPNVRLEPPTDRPQRYLAAADVLLVPSDTEGIPAVAIEAGLSGVPVVASDVGGLSSVIDHQRTGLLVPAGDDAALAEAVQRAAAEGPFWAEAARRRCLDRFDLDAVAVRWDEVMRRAARPRTGA